MERLIERWYPALISSLAVIAYLSIKSIRSYMIPTSFSELLSAAVSISGIAIGFLATAKSILIAIDDREIIRKLKQIHRYKPILEYIWWAILWSFILAVFSAFGLLVDLTAIVTWGWIHAGCFAIWLFVAVQCGLTCYRVVQVLYAILNYDS